MDSRHQTSAAAGSGQFGAPNEKAQIDAEAFRSKMERDRVAAPLVVRPPSSLTTPQPLLSELQDRLSRAVASLTNGNARIGEATCRILGPALDDVGGKGGTTAGNDRPPSAADVLYALLDRIEEEAERLHHLADRIERIG